ncbi:hypothetical protein WDU94_000338, partial [Cyamophila willieti]
MIPTTITTNSLKRINKDENIDEIRQRNIAYEYLCHLEEAKIWIESCIKESLPPCTELETNLRNGVVLAKLGHYLNPDLVPECKIYDVDQSVYTRSGLRFRHTDNINYFIKSVVATQLPRTFLPETVDIYEAKNLPRLIYCIHALSRHLFRTGHAPLIQDLFGKVTFTEADIDTMAARLEEEKVSLPAFQKLNSLLAKDVTVVSGVKPLQTLEAINQAIREKDVPSLISLLKAPAYSTVHCLFPVYMNTLYDALQEKMDQMQNHSLNESFEPDEYSELLTQAEIQGYLSQLNIDYVWELLVGQGGTQRPPSVWETLRQTHVNIKNLVQDYDPFYQCQLSSYISQHATSLASLSHLASNEKLSLLQRFVYRGNEEAMNAKYRSDVMCQINTLLNRILNRAHASNPTSRPKDSKPVNSNPSKLPSLSSSSFSVGYCKPWTGGSSSSGKGWASVSSVGLNKMMGTSSTTKVESDTRASN